MNQKISRNEKHKYSNEEKLALGEDENTSTQTKKIWPLVKTKTLNEFCPRG